MKHMGEELNVKVPIQTFKTESLSKQQTVFKCLSLDLTLFWCQSVNYQKQSAHVYSAACIYSSLYSAYVCVLLIDLLNQLS